MGTRRVVRTHEDGKKHRQLLADAINSLVGDVNALSGQSLTWALPAVVAGAVEGSLLAIVNTGYALAQNDQAGYAARCVVRSVSGGTVTLGLQARVDRTAHGKGSPGDTLWLEVDGDVTSTKPANVKNWQRVGFVEDANHLVLTVDPARYEE